MASWSRFWKGVGNGAATVAKAGGSVALWASQHPEVIAGVATIAGHPEVGAVIKGLPSPSLPKPAPVEIPPVEVAQPVTPEPPVDLVAKWGAFVTYRYRLAKTDGGLNKYPDDQELKSDCENVEKYGADWFIGKMWERSGEPRPVP